MKNLEKFFMLLGFVSSISSMGIAIYTKTPWIWQFTTSLWIIVAYIKTKTIETIEKV